jgi:peptidoglycan-associated lipoprotein
MKIKLLGALAAVSLLAACSSGEQTAAATGAGATGPRPGSQEDLVANVGDRIFFDTDRSNVRADQRATLERQAAWMGRFPTVQVAVEGHADKYRGQFAAGAQGFVAWQAMRSTVIKH